MRLLERYLEYTIYKSSEGVVEMNTGCFGGLDAVLVKQVLIKTFREFFSYLRTQKTSENIFSEKENAIRDFFAEIYFNEVEGLENLFLKSLQNLVKIILQEMERKESRNFFLISTGTAHKIKGEENNIFLNEMQNIKGIRSEGLTILEFVNLYNKAENKESFLNEAFVYDDFTDKELEIYCNENDLDFTKVKEIFSKINSFYPKDIDYATDRDFAEVLNACTDKHPLIKEIVNSKKIDSYNIPDLENKVLKLKETDSGKGIYLPGEFDEDLVKKFLNENKNFTLENFLSGAKIYVLENGKMEEKVADVRFGFYYDPRFPNEIKTITTYGRYNDEGKKSNVAQGGGVAEITIVKDENFKTCHEKLLKAYRSLDKEDLKQLQALLNENTNKANLQYNGKPFPIAITPFIVSESAFRKVEKTALFLAQKIVAKREGENKGKAFIFALDAFINPSPDTDKN